jgi:hypothetical protein
MREVSLWLPTRGYGMPGAKRYNSRACYVLFPPLCINMFASLCLPHGLLSNKWGKVRVGTAEVGFV